METNLTPEYTSNIHNNSFHESQHTASDDSRILRSRYPTTGDEFTNKLSILQQNITNDNMSSKSEPLNVTNVLGSHYIINDQFNHQFSNQFNNNDVNDSLLIDSDEITNRVNINKELEKNISSSGTRDNYTYHVDENRHGLSVSFNQYSNLQCDNISHIENDTNISCKTDETHNITTTDETLKNTENTRNTGRVKRGLPPIFLKKQQEYEEKLKKEHELLGSKKISTKKRNSVPNKKTSHKTTKSTKSTLNTVSESNKIKACSNNSTKNNQSDLSIELPIKKSVKNVKSDNASIKHLEDVSVSSDELDNTIPMDDHVNKNKKTHKATKPRVMFVEPNKSQLKRSQSSDSNSHNSHNGHNSHNSHNGYKSDHNSCNQHELNKMIQMNNKKNNCNNTQGKHVHPHYARMFEQEVKQNTLKNIQNFGELIKAKEFAYLDTCPDVNRASLNQIRQMRLEQKIKEREVHKKQHKPKENDLEAIMKNDKMTPLAKLLAVKRISVSSRSNINRAQHKVQTVNSD
jgi:hypothetical protein